MSNDLDSIIKELEEDDNIKNLPIEPPPQEEKITDENMNDFILRKMGKLVDEGVSTIQTIQQSVMAGIDSDELQALSSLISAITKAADTLNKINIQNKKDKTAKELKIMEIEANKNKKQLSGSSKTNVFIATREELLKELIGKNKKTIEVGSVEIKPEPEDYIEVKDEN